MEITLEKIELVKDRTGVAYKEAKEALEKTDGSVVDAIILIEESIDEPARSGEKNIEILDTIKEAVRKGNVSKIVVKKGEEVILNLPVNIGIIGTVLFPWAALGGCIAALGTRCRIEMVKEDGGVVDVSEKAAKTLETVKDKGSVIYDEVKDKGGDLLETAKDKGAVLLETARDKGGDFMEVAKDKGAVLLEVAKDKGGDFVEVAKDKGAVLLEVAKDKGGDIVEVAKDKGSVLLEVAKDKGGDFVETAKDKGGDLYEIAKEAIRREKEEPVENSFPAPNDFDLSDLDLDGMDEE